jgi:hypothetical protein
MSRLLALVSLVLFVTNCAALAVLPDSTQPREATPVARAIEPSASAGGLQVKFRATGKVYFGTCADPNTLNIACTCYILPDMRFVVLTAT